MKNDYDRISRQWAGARREHYPEQDRAPFERFVKDLPQNPHVLDLGCGTGIPIAGFLVESGASVFGIERSTHLLSMAKSNVPEGDFVPGDVETFDVEETFDGVVIWDVIFHLERQKHRGILERIYSCLRPGGLLIISNGGSDHPPFTDTMFGEEFFYDAHPPDEFLAICADIGFEIVIHTVLDEADGGRSKGRIGTILKRI